jgi:hypothetical protein
MKARRDATPLGLAQQPDRNDVTASAFAHKVLRQSVAGGVV